jgi:hypothetical protein
MDNMGNISLKDLRQLFFELPTNNTPSEDYVDSDL